MKIKNNNSESIKKLTRRSLRDNKTRNIILCLAITVTMFMIFTVFTFFYSLTINSDIMWTRITGTKANVALTNPTDEQIDMIKDYDLIQNQGIYINVGNVTNGNLEELDKRIFLVYNDAEYFETMYTPSISDIVGTYPVNADEIMISRKTLEYLDYDEESVELLDELELSYKIKDVEYTKIFKITGIYTDYNIKSSTTTLVSDNFIYDHGLSKENDGNLYMRAKTLDRHKVSSYLDENFPLNDGQSLSYSFDTQSADTTLFSIIFAIIMSLIFVLSGFLLIYNIMYISVVRDINFYGLLKTIGTSPKQIKKIVRNQVYLLSLIGIPIGIILSSIVSYVVVPLILSGTVSDATQHALPIKIYFNPIIFIFSILFLFLTIHLSCRKPAKIASKISPVEAMRYINSGENTIKKKKRKRTSGGKIYKMAWYNVFRDKKKTTITFLSLFLGIITYLCIVTFLNGMQMDKYIDENFLYDLEVYVRNFYDEENNNYITDEFIESILEYEGIREVEKQNTAILEIELDKEILLVPMSFDLRFDYSEDELEEKTLERYEQLKMENDFIETRFVGLSDNLAEKLYDGSEDKFDLKAFKNGELALIFKRFYFHEDTTFENQLTVRNEDNVRKFNLQTIDNGNFVQGSGNGTGMPIFVVSESALKDLTTDISYRQIYINYDKKYRDEYEELFKDIVVENNFGLESKLDIKKSFDETTLIMNVLGGFISFILIFTGLLNFINLIITSLYSRQRELALLESVGMTKKQVNKLITYEALYYSLITGGLVLTLGLPIIYGVGQMTEIIVNYAIFSYPVIEMCSIITLAVIVSFVTTQIVYKIISKESTVERLKIS